MASITNRYTGLLEQALGLTEGSHSDIHVDDKELKALFSDQALGNPGFKRLQGDFAKSAADGNPSRAFAWAPIHAEFVSPDTIRFTFTLNLWYAIGLAAHLEVELKQEDGVWKFHDFGTLETEKMEGVQGYNGLLIKDPLV
ncbi:hypothetical protein [Cohnella yongneupensis]|uniref:SnoaL-like domain-containing protein n=1 Tax=Cohnella yongneupensis TaxID=425006 RepID=A0ABW0QVM1_9BACL